MKWDWILIVTCFVLLAVLYVRKSYYAPPREATTVLPFVEPSANAIAEATGQYSNSNIYPVQSDVFKDASGWLNMREHPLTDFFQENAFSNVATYGSFVGLESSSGNAPMYLIPSPDTSNVTQLETSNTTTCRSSVAIINYVEYGSGIYTNLDLTGEIQVYPPLNVIATGPDGARQQMSYSTSDNCPLAERLVLDRDKTFNTLQITV